MSSSSTPSSSSLPSSRLALLAPFDGSAAHFPVWELRTEATFEANLWPLVAYSKEEEKQIASARASSDSSSSSKGASSAAVSEEQRSNKLAYNALLGAIPDDLATLFAVKAHKNACALWTLLTRHFKSSSLANKNHVRDKLQACRAESAAGYLATPTT